MKVCAILKKTEADGFLQALDTLKSSSVILTQQNIDDVCYVINTTEEEYSFLKLRLGTMVWVQ